MEGRFCPPNVLDVITLFPKAVAAPSLASFPEINGKSVDVLRDITIFGKSLMKNRKSYLTTHSFWFSHLISTKSTFLKALTKIFRMKYHLGQFADVSTFPLFSLMTSLWRHTVILWIFNGNLCLLQGYITAHFGSFNCCNSQVIEEKLKNGIFRHMASLNWRKRNYFNIYSISG